MEEKKKKGRMVALGSRPSCGKSLSCGSACEQGTEPLTFDLPVKQGGGDWETAMYFLLWENGSHDRKNY